MNCNLFFTSSRACLFISRVTGGADEDCGCLAWQRAAAKRWQESSFNTVLFLPGMAKKITKRPGLRLFRGAVLVTSLCRALQPGLHALLVVGSQRRWRKLVHLNGDIHPFRELRWRIQARVGYWFLPKPDTRFWGD